MADITIFIAFLAGVASFLSPCVFPLVPAFLSYISGVTSSQVQANAAEVRLKVIVNTIFFILGFSLVFAILGAFISLIPYDARSIISKIGGIVIIGFGLYLLGLLKLQFLEQEHRLRVKKFSSTYLTSFLFGASFGAGWSPCVGAVLGAVLTLAVTNSAAALPLLLSYSLGIMLPFLLAGIFFSQVTGIIRKYAPLLKYFNTVMGVALIILGILVFTENLAKVANLALAQVIMG